MFNIYWFLPFTFKSRIHTALIDQFYMKHFTKQVQGAFKTQLYSCPTRLTVSTHFLDILQLPPQWLAHWVVRYNAWEKRKSDTSPHTFIAVLLYPKLKPVKTWNKQNEKSVLMNCRFSFLRLSKIFFVYFYLVVRYYQFPAHVLFGIKTSTGKKMQTFNS